MTRLKVALGILSLLAVLGFPASAGAFSAVSQFGFSDGTLVDNGSYTQLDNMRFPFASIPRGNSGPFFRSAVHWSPIITYGPFGGTTSEGMSYTKYDTAVGNAWADGFMMLPEIHTSWPTSGTPSCTGVGCYIDPGSADCTGSNGCGWAHFQQAVEDFALRYGPNGDYIHNVDSTFPGITRYEIWNEPNTKTGSAQYDPSTMTVGTGDLDPQEMDNILHYESAGLAAAAAHNGWSSQLQIVCCAFGNPGGSHAFSLTYFKTMLGVSGNTVWSDINPSSSSQYGVVSVHMYYKVDTANSATYAPDNCPANYGTSETTAAEKCPQFLENSWAPYIHTTESQPNVGMAITEGGYSGPHDNGGGACSTSSPGTVTEAQQANWNAWTIQYYQHNPDIGLEFLSYYTAADDNASTDTGQTCWQAGLAPVDASGDWKRWASNLHLIVGATVTSGQDALDTFGRTLPSAWTDSTHQADIGGVYTQSGTAAVSTNASKGIMVLSSPSQNTMRLDGMTPDEGQDDSVDVVITALPSSGNTVSFMLGGRRQTDPNTGVTSYYQARYDVNSSGKVNITFKSIVGSTTSVLGSASTPNCTFTTNTVEHLAFDMIGSSPTHLSASCYAGNDGVDGGSTSFGSSGTGSIPFALEDTTPSLQSVMGTSLVAAQSSNASMSNQVTTKFDNFEVFPEAPIA